MDSSQPTGRSELLAVLDEPPSLFATIYLPSPSAIEDAEQQFAIRTKNVRQELEQANASESMVALVDEALGRADHADAAGRFLVVSDDRIVLDRDLVRPVDRVDVTLSPIPAILPMLEISRIDVPHVAVLVDRTGAHVYERSGVADPVDVDVVEGEELHVQRSHPGGWSQQRFQARAENTWEQNAKQTVDEILAEHPDVELIIVGGDVRAVGFFTENVPNGPTVVEVEGSRSADHDAFLDNADRVLRTRAAEAQVAALDRVKEAVATGNGAEGETALQLMTQGRAAEVIIGNDHRARDRETGLFDLTIPAYIDDSEAWDTEQALTVPVADAALLMAHRLGTEVVVVPEGAASRFDLGVAVVSR